VADGVFPGALQDIGIDTVFVPVEDHLPMRASGPDTLGGGVNRAVHGGQYLCGGTYWFGAPLRGGGGKYLL